MEKSAFIRFGDFLFKTRNWLFPTVLAFICFAFIPADTYLGSELLEEGKDALAITIVLLGLGIRAFVIGFAYIKRGGLNKQVYADTLVTSGIFGLSRNPLYVGNLLVYFGVFLMHGNLLVLVLGTLTFTVFYLAIVAAEEHFLKNKFGAEYDAYCAQVPRWLPKLNGIKQRFRTSTKDMDYDLKRVIFKDYTTIINALVPLLLLEFYEDQIWHAGDPNVWLTPANLLACLIACGLAVLVIRMLKKSAA